MTLRYLYDTVTGDFEMIRDSERLVEISDEDRDEFTANPRSFLLSATNDGLDEVGEAESLYAFVSRDRDAGVVGLKQGYTAVGLTPLVATERAKIDRDWLRGQMKNVVANPRGETVLLVRYKASEVLLRVEPDRDHARN